ncbi:hypothetical protein EJ04DRAFT_572801 [Polyplosphaeria fusca]|uniref:Peptidase S28 n=1 Tax=Polyplosphaeria fusca TaxID=682080 RepID=A0A9P4RAW1_9PLEO|nr:hypothetical protein EJ04DRAFT_572801 [Polyplosphaeria fusca]
MFLSKFLPQALILSFLTIASAAGYCPLYEVQLYDQKIDHAGNHNGTFKQQYQLTQDYYKPGGPLIMYQGAENGYFSCMEYLSLLSYAAETEALLVGLNHRYFNESVPFGPITNASYDWQYLTLDNVMKDSVEFVRFVKQQVPAAANATTIVAGGSYGGFLTMMLRLNHPETFHGAIASAAPVHLECANFPNTTYQWVQPDYVSNVYEDLSWEIAQSINQSWTVMEEMITKGNGTGVQDELNLCTAPSNATDFFSLQNVLSTGLQRLSQFNYPQAQASSTNVSLPLNHLIKHASNSTSVFAPLKEYTKITMSTVNPATPDCYDWTTGGSAAVGGAGVSMLSFGYIFCTYFPLTTCGATRPGGIFYPDPPQALTYEAGVAANCAAYGNVHLWTPQELSHAYKLNDQSIANMTNILFTLGQYDPITGYSVGEFETDGDVHAPRRWYASNTAHTQDIVAWWEGDSQGVMDQRNASVAYIKAWTYGG